MTDHRQVFIELMRSYLERAGKAPDQIQEADDYLLDVGGRIVQIRLVAEGTMLISTMVFFNEGREEQVLEERIAEFNAFQLLSGGYSLLVEEESLSLYVEQALSAGAFDAASLSTHLADFTDRAVSCSRWYLGELENALAGSRPAAPIQDHMPV